MRRPSVPTALSLLALLVALSGTAYAATGDVFVLGRSNKANAVSTLTNPKGTPLSLSAPAESAPLAVNSSTVVANLNASQVGGKSAVELGSRATVARAAGPSSGWTTYSGALEPWGGGRMAVSVRKHAASSCLLARWSASNYVTDTAGRVNYGVFLTQAGGPVDSFVTGHYFNQLSAHQGWSGAGVFAAPAAGDYEVTLHVGSGTPFTRVAVDQNDSATLEVLEVAAC